MKTKNFYDFTVSYNNNKGIDIFENQKNNIVYKLIFPDNTFYIGKTTNIRQRLIAHCGNNEDERLKERPLFFKKKEYRRFIVEILHYNIKEISTMNRLEKKEITKAADYICKQHNLKAYNSDIINQYLLNSELYQNYSEAYSH